MLSEDHFVKTNLSGQLPIDVLQICEMIKGDAEMMQILELIASLGLSDWCVCNGFIKNKVWDYIHGYSKKTTPRDIDVLYFDPESERGAQQVSRILEKQLPTYMWDVSNQAFAHSENNDMAYANLSDALSKMPDTVSSVGVRLENNKINLIAPLGINDLINCIIRPTPIFYEHSERKQIILERLYLKRPFDHWPLMQIII